MAAVEEAKAAGAFDPPERAMVAAAEAKFKTAQVSWSKKPENSRLMKSFRRKRDREAGDSVEGGAGETVCPRYLAVPLNEETTNGEKSEPTDPRDAKAMAGRMLPGDIGDVTGEKSDPSNGQFMDFSMVAKHLQKAVHDLEIFERDLALRLTGKDKADFDAAL